VTGHCGGFAPTPKRKKRQPILYVLMLWEDRPLSRLLPSRSGRIRPALYTKRPALEEQARTSEKGQWTLLKAAAALVYRAREPKRPCSPRTEHNRTERPVCWQCGGVGHHRKDCRLVYSQKHFPDKGQLSPVKRTKATKKATILSLVPPRYALSETQKHGHDNMHAEV
jgi:hypothetical protein